jgi:hypothetical protein
MGRVRRASALLSGYLQCITDVSVTQAGSDRWDADNSKGCKEVQVRTGAWLLIGIGSALVIVTLLAVFVVPAERWRRPSNLTPRRQTPSRFKIPFGSPAGSLLKGFSYLYAPLRYPRVHYSVGGRLQLAIARIDAIEEPSAAPQRVGEVLQQVAETVGPAEPPAEGGEPVVDLFQQPRSEEP